VFDGDISNWQADSLIKFHNMFKHSEFSGHFTIRITKDSYSYDKDDVYQSDSDSE